MQIEDNACAQALKILSDYWTLRIIDALSDGSLRFSDLQRTIGNCNPVTLTDRLKKLEEAQLLNRQEAKENIAVTYSLTTLGEQALPAVAAMTTFAHKVHSIDS